MSNFSTKILGLAGLAMSFASMSYALPGVCGAPIATTGIIRAEGTAEQVASVQFTCTVGAGGQGGGLGVNAQVFLSPSLPVTSRVLFGSTTEATLTVASNSAGAGPATQIQGTVSGSTINFSGTTPTGAQAAADTLTFTITNVRVNATSLSVGTGVPPSISETVFVSGAAVVPVALASTGVAFAQNGLGATKTFKTFTNGTGAAGVAPVPAGGLFPAGYPYGTAATAGVNSFVICNAYNPKNDAFTNAASASIGTGKSLAAVVEVNENFAQSFKTAGDDAPQTVYAANAFNAGSSAANSVISTRVKLNFANVPSNVTLYLPTGAISSNNFSNGIQPAAITWVTSDTGTTATSASSAAGLNGIAAAPVSVTSGAGSATFSVTTSDLTNLDKFEVPVFVITTANSVPGSATPMTVSVSFAPVGSTSIPNFVVGASTATTTLSTFNLCTTSLLFPFITNQLGFDTGIAISNTSTDPFGTNGATAQAGTCTLNFYGAGAPSPSAVTLPTSAAGNTVASGTTGAVVLSSVAAGFQGYMIAQCAFQYAHGFAFITNGAGGLSQGYLAGVIPDVNQKSRAADPLSAAGAGSGETLGN